MDSRKSAESAEEDLHGPDVPPAPTTVLRGAEKTPGEFLRSSPVLIKAFHGAQGRVFAPQEHELRLDLPGSGAHPALECDPTGSPRPECQGPRCGAKIHMSQSENATCEGCTHFRSAPYEARLEGCYLPANMPVKQTASYLDEQQLPGDHRVINRGGKCPDRVAREPKPSFLDRWVRD